uniref:ZP domain-containing protein n=1 Tax=Meloidogyne hapla TaxID=6305 RepID=A0A1I8B5K6_MELHA
MDGWIKLSKLRFLANLSCSITVCLRDSGRCDGITPPQCSQIMSDSFDDTKRVKRDYLFNKSDEWELHSPLITVFDPVDQNNENNDFTQKTLPLHKAKLSPPTLPEFCLSVLSLCALVSISTFLVTIISGAILIILLFRDPISDK